MKGPRSNRDPKLVSAKLGRLRENHVVPVTNLVARIRDTTGNDAVPYVDPTLGGVNARVLFLLIELLPGLRLVVTMGEIARRSFSLHLLRRESPLVPWLAVAHPSGRVRSSNPALWRDAQAAFVKAAEIVRDDPS